VRWPTCEWPDVRYDPSRSGRRVWGLVAPCPRPWRLPGGLSRRHVASPGRSASSSPIAISGGVGLADTQGEQVGNPGCAAQLAFK
jgi:hypothetical protein